MRLTARGRRLGAAGVTPSSYAPRDLVRDVVAGVLQRPSRTVLTMLGTVLGVGALVTIIGLTTTARSQIDARFSALASTTLEVKDVGSGNDADPRISLPADSGRRVRVINGVTRAGRYWPIQFGGAIATQPGQPSTSGSQVTLTAVDPGALSACVPVLTTGRFYDAFHESRSQRVALLGSVAASQLGISRVDGAPAVFLGDKAYTVIGIVADVRLHPELLFSVIIPTTTAVADFGPPTDPRAAMVVRTRLGAAQVVAAQVAIAVRPDQPRLLQVQAPTDPTALRSAVAGDINSLFVVLALVSLVAGALGIANTTLVAVMERVGEIGLRRSLGARRRHITLQFLSESTLVGLVGGLAGASLAVVVIVAVAVTRSWTAVVPTGPVLLAPVLGGLVGLLAGAYPALRAARVEPVQALRR